jgi:hypothetical protein
MNVNKIFNLFGNDEVPEDNNEIDNIIDWRDTPTYKIGMFKKIIINNKMIKNVFIKNLKENGIIDLDEEDMEKAGEFLAYNRSWDYIKDCDINNDVWKDALLLSNKEEIISILINSILFFENSEEYEKCALLKSILDFLNLNLAS